MNMKTKSSESIGSWNGSNTHCTTSSQGKNRGSNEFSNCDLYRKVREQIRRIRDLPQNDKFRAYATTKMLDKLYKFEWIFEEKTNSDLSIGLISTKESLQEAEKVTASAFCRRRLPVVMMKLKMAQTLKIATEFIEQGHVRIGPDICLDLQLFWFY